MENMEVNMGFSNDGMVRSAYNLLVNCAGVKQSEKVLIVAENPELGWYEQEPVDSTVALAKKIGCAVNVMAVGEPGNSVSDELLDAAQASDLVIFFSRIGDSIRFSENPQCKKMAVVYARKSDVFRSRFGWAEYGAFVDLTRTVNSILLNGSEIRVTCPQGTDFSGTLSAKARQNAGDVSILRFPLGVPQPVPAADFSGRVALVGYLTSTGSRTYDPSHLKLSGKVIVEVRDGRIHEITGGEEDRKSISRHMDHISELFGIDPLTVHSWHAGLNPDCACPSISEGQPDQWSNTVFNNPKYLHFHTCGDYAPGEICWMVGDPTISIGGTNLWENGKLVPGNFESGRNCVEKWPILKEVFKD